MTASQRDQRTRIYAYAETGVDGMPGTSYVHVPGNGVDSGWWSRKEPASAMEVQRAQQQQHEVQWVFTFALDAPVTTDGALKDVRSGTMYLVTGMYPARLHHELIVHAVEASDEVYSNVVEV